MNGCATAGGSSLSFSAEAIFSRRLLPSCVRMVGVWCGGLIEWKGRVWNSVHTWQILLLRSMAGWNFIYLFLHHHHTQKKKALAAAKPFNGAKMWVLLLMIELSLALLLKRVWIDIPHKYLPLCMRRQEYSKAFCVCMCSSRKGKLFIREMKFLKP